MAGFFGWLTRRTPSATKTVVGTDGVDLEARNLVKAFGQRETRALAVNDVGLKLKRGELTLLMGPSGSGKSTLLAMISGLLQPDSGSVTALGEDLWARSKEQME